MVHHPDKPGCDWDVFKRITEAYRLVGEFLEEHGDMETIYGENEYDFEANLICGIEFSHSTMEPHWTKRRMDSIGKFSTTQMELSLEILRFENGICRRKTSKQNFMFKAITGNVLPVHYVDNVLPKLFEEVSRCNILEQLGNIKGTPFNTRRNFVP